MIDQTIQNHKSDSGIPEDAQAAVERNEQGAIAIQESKSTVTKEEFRAELDRQGKTLNAWAVEHGFKPIDVHYYFNGKTKGARGVSHNIAVTAGIKAGVVSQ